MTALIYGQDAEFAAWAAERIPHVDNFGPSAAIGVVDDAHTRVLAAMVFHDYQPDCETIQISMAADSPMWARRRTIGELLAYPFRQLGVFKAWAISPIDNEKAIRTNLHAGFRKEATLAHHFGRRRHGVVCRLLAPDYTRIYGGTDG